MLNLTFAAMRELKTEGHTLPMLFVVHSDTRVENPVIHAFNREQIRQIKAYAFKTGIETKVMIARPSLSNDYLVGMLGGRTIGSVGAVSKCQQMMKATPLSQLKSKIRKWVAAKEGIAPKDASIVSLIGTRRDESAVRAARMESRAESATDAVEVMTGSGDLVLSPIADFTTMEIFDYLSRVRNGKIESYADDQFNGLVEIYRAMNSGECMVNMYLAGKESTKSGCASGRSGCWTCLRVTTDASAEAMIADEEGKYLWLKPLNDFRNYLMARHYDPSARCWIGRTVGEDGKIDIIPNAYSPSFTRELLGILLTVQRDEEIAARELGIAPRFTLLDEKQLLAIDLLWARYGYQQAFTALRTYDEVYEHGKRYEIPSLETIPRFTKADVAFRSRAPFADHEYDAPYNGLQSMEHAIVDAMPLTTTRRGLIVSDVNTGEEFGMDDEGLAMFMDFEREYALQRHPFNSYPSAVVHYLMSYGVVHIYKGTHGEWDRMLKVNNQMWRHGLQPILNDPHAILARLAAALPSSADVQTDIMPDSHKCLVPGHLVAPLSSQQQMFLFL